MQEIYKHKDNCDDTLIVDMLPMEQHGKDEVMFSVMHPVRSDDVSETFQMLSVLLPMDEVSKLINRLTIELDVIAHRPTGTPRRPLRPLD